MTHMSMKNVLYTVFLICAGVVVGSCVANATASVPGLSWLGYGLSLGITEPLVLNLGVISITFALTFNLSVSVVIFLAIFLLIGRFFKPWRS